MTFDHEHVPPLLLKALEDDGVAVRPGGRALVLYLLPAGRIDFTKAATT